MKLARIHWSGWCAVAVAGVVTAALSLAVAQTPPPFNEREVRKEQNAQDRDDIWVLDFHFKDPRLITMDIPGVKGRKVVWYLWYQVSNRTGKPQTFTPDFELVTHDRPHVYHDQVLPKVQDAIRRIEDPAGHLDIKNSVTIGANRFRRRSERLSQSSPAWRPGTTSIRTPVISVSSSAACPMAGPRTIISCSPQTPQLSFSASAISI